MEIYNTNPLTYNQFTRYLDNNGYNSRLLTKKIDTSMKLVLKASEKYLGKLKHLKSNKSFQLFGVDYMITNSLHPYLLEINKGPDMIPKNMNDEIIKTTVLEDIFKLLNIIKFDKNHGFRKIL